ncbi:MAG: TerC family protein [Bacteroidetes bacterium]|nr:TerC family protein [Bacteroidota bacterium]
MTQPEGWAALLTLTALEIVLGIDNIVFISILAGKLPARQQPKARTVGLGFAMVTRIALLLSITWIMRLTEPLFEVVGQEISGRDIIFILGGLFLLAKSTHEIHDSLEGAEKSAGPTGVSSFMGVVIQIGILDIVFSLDSVITAVGMARHVSIMITAIVIAILFMIAFAGAVSSFVHRHPTVKMLALAFLVLIGVTLIAEGFGQHVSKGYIYFAMAFSVFVEMLNMRFRKVRVEPVALRSRFSSPAE